MNKDDRIAKKLERIAKNIVAGDQTFDPDYKPSDQSPSDLYVWVKGEVHVYACKITDENLEVCKAFVKKFCKEENQVKTDRYVVYNPDIAILDGPVWTNKLNKYKPGKEGQKNLGSINGSIKTTDKDFNGLVFEPFVFIPEKGSDDIHALLKKEGAEGSEYFIGFKMPKGMGFYAPTGYGNGDANGKIVAEPGEGCDYWLAIQNGKFDYGRTITSMKQSNYIGHKPSNDDKIKPLDEECKKLWELAVDQFKTNAETYNASVKAKTFPEKK